MTEEPEYQVFDYVCPQCDHHYNESNSVKKHPDHQVCPACGKSGRAEPVIHLAGKAKQVFSYMALLARHRGNTTIGELATSEGI